MTGVQEVTRDTGGYRVIQEVTGDTSDTGGDREYRR